MLFEFISMILGLFKLFLFKVIYPLRIYVSGIPKINSNFYISIRKKSKLVIGKGFRARNDISFRVYDNGKIEIGNNCFFNDGCSINCRDKIVIGNNVICGQNVLFFDHDHNYKNDMNEFIKKEIVIGNNVWLGANCTILKGVTIGENVVVGANTLIKEDIPSNSIVYQKKELIIKREN